MEYITCTCKTCQAIWPKRILKDMKQSQEESTIIYCDNQSTITTIKNSMFHSLASHIETHHHFIRQMVSIKMDHWSTKNKWDIFTKFFCLKFLLFFIGCCKTSTFKGEYRRNYYHYGFILMFVVVYLVSSGVPNCMSQRHVHGVSRGVLSYGVVFYVMGKMS